MFLHACVILSMRVGGVGFPAFITGYMIHGGGGVGAGQTFPDTGILLYMVNRLSCTHPTRMHYCYMYVLALQKSTP